MAVTRIKICGITTPADAHVAAVAGVDAIGLVFYPPSPRAVNVDQALEVLAVLPPFVTVVALFVDESVANIMQVLERVPIDVLQFHGDESADFCLQFKRPYIKALRVRPELDIAAACSEHSSARGILLDSWQLGVPGGTGTTFDWQLTPDNLPLPVILAGGLDTENVASAIIQTGPAAVDISGGVESAPGIKNEKKVRDFICAVRHADQELGDIE